jgi:hypothetical protein
MFMVHALLLNDDSYFSSREKCGRGMSYEGGRQNEESIMQEIYNHIYNVVDYADGLNHASLRKK